MNERVNAQQRAYVELRKRSLFRAICLKNYALEQMDLFERLRIRHAREIQRTILRDKEGS